MKENNKLIRVYTGTEVSVYLLKDMLEQNGISSIIKNDFNSGISAGFAGGVPSAIDIYIKQSDLKNAESIIGEFIKSDKS